MVDWGKKSAIVNDGGRSGAIVDWGKNAIVDDGVMSATFDSGEDWSNRSAILPGRSAISPGGAPLSGKKHHGGEYFVAKMRRCD